MQTFTILMYMESAGGARNFCLGGQVATLIYLSRQPPKCTYTHAFLLYTLFYLISYTHTHTHPTKNKNLVFLIKIMFDGDLS